MGEEIAGLLASYVGIRASGECRELRHRLRQPMRYLREHPTSDRRSESAQRVRVTRRPYPSADGVAAGAVKTTSSCGWLIATGRKHVAK